MQSQEAISEVAALRHAFHVNRRLRLEFLGGLSKLLREYGVSARDELLSSVILSVPEEVMSGHSLAQQSSGKKSEDPPDAPEKNPDRAPERAPEIDPMSPDQAPAPAPGVD